MSRADPVTQALQQAVDQGVFPGAVLYVRCQGQVVYHRGIGSLGRVSFDRPVQPETVYDLASLTKPLATATAILWLIQEGCLHLDQPASHWLTEWASSPYRSTTIRQLLRHGAGLPAYRPYYQTLSPRGLPPSTEAERLQRIETVLRLIADEPMEHRPDARSLYSDLGFMALGVLVERAVGTSLGEYCRRRVYEPLHAKPLWFIGQSDQAGGHGDEMENVAPTEDDPWRGYVVHKHVHDENAFALGGVTGHAGLFGTASAVAALSGAWLQAARGRESFFPAELVREFVGAKPLPNLSWRLGWDSPSIPSSSGVHFSPQSFGHLGYSGTSVWIDPTREVEVILLTNRVHPTRTNKRITTFRPTLHDLVWETFVAKEKDSGFPSAQE